jgi:hemin uptake protein HemP
MSRGGESVNHQPRLQRTAEPESASSAPLVVESATLMSGRRELLIRHGEDTYRLRVTASNKLILTK